MLRNLNFFNLQLKNICIRTEAVVEEMVTKVKTVNYCKALLCSCRSLGMVLFYDPNSTKSWEILLQSIEISFQSCIQ